VNLDDKTMLALAALTYRGVDSRSESEILEKLDPWLPKVEAEGLGRWEIAWGPASFRVPFSIVDDAMAYVVCQTDRATGARPRYVVAIRGTNPVSAFDWVLGDLWVRDQVEWPASASPGAKVSASSFLGLSIVRNLAAGGEPRDTGSLMPLADALTEALRDVGPEVEELDFKNLLRTPSSFTDSALKQRIAARTRDDGAPLRQQALGSLGGLLQLEAAAPPVRGALSRLLLDRLVHFIEKTGARDPGRTLLEFLRDDIGRGARVNVTGHSKGGALANMVALWLAEEWAPAARGEVWCFSFASPTAGNTAFAQHYDGRLGPRTRRVVNRFDLVPYAWDVSDLRRVSDVYPKLRSEALVVARWVEGLDYTHAGGAPVEIRRRRRRGRHLVQKIIHQHLDAYLEDAGFQDPSWNTRCIMLD
jgi:hypothetical protein